MSKKSFYCWYLGYTEAYGPHGNARVYEVIQNILKFYYQIDRSRSQIVPNSSNSHSNPNITFHDFNNLNIKFNSQITPSKITICLNENCLNLIDTSQVVSQQNQSRKKASHKRLTDSDHLTPDLLSKVNTSLNEHKRRL
jgi:hypothetical protein